MASIERYLEQADFYRAVAENTADPGTRICLEYLVRSFKVLAESQKQLQQLAKAQQVLRQLYRPLAGQVGDRPPLPGGTETAETHDRGQSALWIGRGPQLGDQRIVCSDRR